MRAWRTAFEVTMRISTAPIPVSANWDGTVPFLLPLIPAGWPSPAEDYVEREANLHDILISNPLATFILTASGDSMTGVGIMDGARLVVDKSVDPYPGAVVIAELDGEMYVKRLDVRGRRTYLVPANPDYPETEVTKREDFRIWGVVVHAISSFRGPRAPVGAKKRKRTG